MCHHHSGWERWLNFQPWKALVEIGSTRTFNLISYHQSNSTYGDRAFTVLALTIWNDLPLYLKTEASLDVFKRDLKTFLFRNAFLSTSS